MAKRSGSGITNGGGGGGSAVGGGSGSATQNVQSQATAPQQAPQPQNVAPTPTRSALDTLQSMSDDELAAIAQKSKTISMPNQLSDIDDITQKFVYAANINEKPEVLDSADFDAFMRQNNLTDSDLLSRSINDIQYTNKSGTKVPMKAQYIADMLMYSRYNYIGGKQGGQALGAGTYFGHRNGQPTGYGSKTIVGVLNPSKARVITPGELQTKAVRFAQTHPKFARAVGAFNTDFIGGKNNMAIYALAMGYNVIWDSGGRGRTNVIDRSALVYRK